MAEELFLARTQKRLGVNVMKSYGELTCMDIDPPEETVGDTQRKNGYLSVVKLCIKYNLP